MERTVVARSLRGRLFIALGVAGLSGCGESPADYARRAREAELLATEATFALNLRDWPRAGQTLARATELDPGRADLWLSLGSVRVRTGEVAEARQAYLKALRGFERAADAAAAKTDPGPTLEQIRVLALLGRMAEARALFAELPRRFAGHPRVRAFIEAGGVDQMTADPAFRAMALAGGGR
ncbi:MAG: tetratricopeptide repeat protein [Opitutaceae bacterium]